MKDCPACGKTTPEEERRCTNCGERLGNPLLSELGNVRPVSGGVLLVLAGLMDSYTPLSRMMGSTPADPTSSLSVSCFPFSYF
ncbi:MAG: hypothetical protein SV760_03910 [Halobacteria archaeon]|nr:hypothetical protein [Halobacteria archaeon]